MKLREVSAITTLLILILGAITSFLSVQIYKKTDGPLETYAEEIIKESTGYVIDFTPNHADYEE